MRQSSVSTTFSIFASACNMSRGSIHKPCKLSPTARDGVSCPWVLDPVLERVPVFIFRRFPKVELQHFIVEAWNSFVCWVLGFHELPRVSEGFLRVSSQFPRRCCGFPLGSMVFLRFSPISEAIEFRALGFAGAGSRTASGASSGACSGTYLL